MRIKIIFNPEAGRGKFKKTIFNIEKYLRQRGINVEVVVTKKKGDAKKEGEKEVEKYDCIVAAGGDGTVNEVVNGMGGKGILGIIPMGTVNLFAREIGMPSGIFSSVDRIIQGKVVEVDLGKAGDHYFTLVAGIGFDATVIDKINVKTKKKFGSLGYIGMGFMELGKYREPTLFLRMDHKIEREGSFVIISNGKRYASEKIRVTPQANLRDGFLDVCIFKRATPLHLLKYTIGVLVKGHFYFRDVEFFKVKQVKVTSKEDKVLVHTDCETIGELPMEFQIIEKGLKVKV
jgi:YegS/Rv2252/BmrU family lipid kinase